MPLRRYPGLQNAPAFAHMPRGRTGAQNAPIKPHSTRPKQTTSTGETRIRRNDQDVDAKGESSKRGGKKRAKELAEVPGLEPGLLDPESSVLPLHHTSAMGRPNLIRALVADVNRVML